MSMQDPIGDMITCIRNSQLSKKKKVYFYYSKFKFSILDIFLKEGFIKKIKIIYLNKNIKKILIYLKYYNNIPVIKEIKRISKPGLRIYKSLKNLPILISGLGIFIISTSKGVITDKKARSLKVGGEVICYIY